MLIEENVIREKCTGCGLCKEVCPKQCISLEMNDEGFFYPHIDRKECIRCGKCINKCPQNTDENNFHEPKVIIGARNCNKNVVKVSSSGGFFPALASWVVKNGGCIFGVGYDDSMQVAHIKVDMEDNLHILQGTKYVQAINEEIYTNVKKELGKGRLVLFSGTPCQNDALIRFLGKEYINLITLEVVCNGVASPGIFSDYIDWIQGTGEKVSQYKFRDKSRLKEFRLSYKVNNEVVRKKAFKDPFYKLFYAGLILRKSCYSCKYAKKERVSDFTIGDFWGIEKVNFSFAKKEGCSLVLMNTEKAQKYWEKIKDEFHYFETSYDDVYKQNKNIHKAKDGVPEKRKKIFELYNSSECFFDEECVDLKKKELFYVLPHGIRKIIKRFI